MPKESNGALEDLVEDLGRLLTVDEMASWLRKDPRTVRKHAIMLGGVEFVSGCLMFSEKRIRSKFKDANSFDETRQETLARCSDNRRKDREDQMVRTDERGPTQGDNMGRRHKKGN